MAQPTSHTSARLLERYGLEPTPKTMGRIRAEILECRSIRMALQHDGLEKHMLRLDGLVMVVIWNPVERFIVTFLPRDAMTAKSCRDHRRACKQRRSAPHRGAPA